MEKENLPNLPRPKSALRSVILESQKIRSDRGEDFFNNKKLSPEEIAGPKPTSKIHCLDENSKTINTDTDFKKLRETHLKLSHLIVDYDKKIFDQNNQVLTPKKPRSKSVHLYIDETIEHFLTSEVKKAETKWGLRKNAGLGQLIQKFILNFMELKKREDRQLKRVKKVFDDFRANLVEFKRSSSAPEEYQAAEQANQKMKILSNDLRILLSLLEFEESELKISLGSDVYTWVDFVLKWKFQS
jgi:hypothetical protein